VLGRWVWWRPARNAPPISGGDSHCDCTDSDQQRDNSDGTSVEVAVSEAHVRGAIAVASVENREETVQRSSNTTSEENETDHQPSGALHVRHQHGYLHPLREDLTEALASMYRERPR